MTASDIPLWVEMYLRHGQPVTDNKAKAGVARFQNRCPGMKLEHFGNAKARGSERSVRRTTGAVNCTAGMAMTNGHACPQRYVDAVWEIRPSSCHQACCLFSFESQFSGECA